MLQIEKTVEPMSSPPSAVLGTSLIIPSRNRPEFLRATVESILKGKQLPDEIIIVDQSDQPHEWLAALPSRRDCEIRYVWTRSIGVSRARNVGIAVARGDMLVFTDDDVLVPADWLGNLVGALIEAGPRSIVTGQVRATEPEAGDGFAPSLELKPDVAIYEGRVGKDVFHTANVALYRSALLQVGMFDERLGPGTAFSTSEDNDLGFRLLESGMRIIYQPKVVLYHRAWRRTRDYLPLRWSYGRGQGAFYAKHMLLRDRYMLSRMLAHLKSHLWGFASRVRHERQLAYGDAVYILGLVTGAVQWLLTQHGKK